MIFDDRDGELIKLMLGCGFCLDNTFHSSYTKPNIFVWPTIISTVDRKFINN